MMKFLLERPIAVAMTFLAAVILGIITYFALPISLLPAIAIPSITVRMSDDNASARELENMVVSPVRHQLMQLDGLQEMKSETRDGLGILRLRFDYGVNTDLAYIEVNEKIDAAMNALPKSASRPVAIKASATDIPVLYLNMTLRDAQTYGDVDEARFLTLCELADEVVRRRIEQLPAVAMADVTGIPSQCIRLIPNRERMAMAGVTLEDLENVLYVNNAEPSAMFVRQGYYEYNIRISNQLRTPSDIENIYMRKAGRLLQLKEFCRVERAAVREHGYSFCMGKRAVTFAIIKQNDENVAQMKRSLQEVTERLSAEYPDVDFTVTQNQTELLDYTLRNLGQNLILSLLLVLLVTLWFIGDVRSSLIIGLSIVVAVIITFFVFYLFDVSLNVISLSGLILAVGMMIDNSLIITDNIQQIWQRGSSLFESCRLGTIEMITPMLSSSLTTVAVFVPLVFMSGITGAIFSDQAFSITAGLVVSYAVGIVLLPVMYLFFYRRKGDSFAVHSYGFTQRSNRWMQHTYLRGIDAMFAHRRCAVWIAVAMLPLCVLLFGVLRKERMPQIDRDDTLVRIDWNENIHLDENATRVNGVMQAVAASCIQQTAYVGVQDYLLNAGEDLSISESNLYLKAASSSDIERLKQEVEHSVKKAYPKALVFFSAPATLFEKIFPTNEADVEVRLHPLRRTDVGLEDLPRLQQRISEVVGQSLQPVPLRDQLNILPNTQNMLLYRVDKSEVDRALSTALKGHEVSVLRSFQQYLPIVIADDESDLYEMLTSTLVRSKADDQGEVSMIPLARLVTLTKTTDLKSITAGIDGTYISLGLPHVDNPAQTVDAVRRTMADEPNWETDFAGNYFSTARTMRELILILCVSVLMMYFILCAQFESFLQPLIVLVEIPIDVTFALLALWVSGHTLNLMSAIGIVVTCGIVVNDSILKLDSINSLRREGMPLLEAIHTAGVRRLRAIVMTTLTTVFAMLPVLFTFDMGSELQQPLAVAMISSMLVGTLVSVFFIPLVYSLIYQRHV
jgi:multidrug efflux pump subunit AcrB